MKFVLNQEFKGKLEQWIGYELMWTLKIQSKKSCRNSNL